MCQLDLIKLKHRNAVPPLPTLAGAKYSNGKRCVNFSLAFLSMTVAKKQQKNTLGKNRLQNGAISRLAS
jgi:hypothetical protein